MAATLHLLAPLCPASPGLGRVTTNVYDALGQLIEVIEPDPLAPTPSMLDNPRVQTFHTSFGKPWKVVDQMNQATTTTYDALGRPVKVTSPPLLGNVSAITRTTYDKAGNATQVTGPLGRVTDTTYDVRNRPTQVQTPAVTVGLGTALVRPTIATTYDALGQVLTVSDPLGNLTTNHYDRAGRKWKVEAPAPSPGAQRPTTVTTFDAGGLPLTVTNALNQTVTNTYDELGRLATTVDAEGIRNSFEYDEAGNRTKVIDGLDQETTFVYDGLNRLVRQTFANGDTWEHVYNQLHKVAQESPRGIVTNYSYDGRDRLLTVSAPAHDGTPALGRAHTYDKAGRLLTVTETGNAAANVSHTYDALGRVLSEVSRGRTHSYEYDLAGNRTRVFYGTGRSTETTYDALNRPKTISEGGRVTSYGYDLAGRALVLSGGNGQTSLNHYDDLGRLKARTLFKTDVMEGAGAQVLAEFNWDHDLLGNVIAQHETWPGDATRQPAGGIRGTVMAYDRNNRLLEETIQTRTSGAAPPVDQSTTLYTYDDANNRASKTVTRIAAPASSAEAGENEVGHWEYSYNAANQLTGWEKWDEEGGSLQKTATLTYDEAGNRVGESIQTQQVSNPANKTYTWDAQDRLLGVTMPDGSEHHYEYDYRTRRIGTGVRTPSSASDEKRTAIVFSGGLSVAEYESTVPVNSPPSALSSPPSVEYTRGPDMGGGVGGLLYSLRSEGGTVTPKYNLSNGRGDIVAQSSQSATLTWTASYEAYGKRTKETGENKDKQRGNSKDEDPTGLLNEGFRYRDIETGVWLSRDPAGFVDGPNLYAYVRQNPWSKFDPLGLEEKPTSSSKPVELVRDKKVYKTLAEAREAFTTAATERSTELHQYKKEHPGEGGVPEFGAFIFSAYNSSKEKLGYVVGPQYEGATPGALVTGRGAGKSVSVGVPLKTPEGKYRISTEQAMAQKIPLAGEEFKRTVTQFGIAEHIHSHPSNLRLDYERRAAASFLATNGRKGELPFSSTDYSTYQSIWEDRKAAQSMNFSVIAVDLNVSPTQTATVTTSLPQNRMQLQGRAPEDYMKTLGVHFPATQ